MRLLVPLFVVVFLFGCSGITMENFKNIKAAIARQEQFVGITRQQVAEKFGKPSTFQQIGAINKDGTADRFEILTYPTWNWRIVVILKNDVVTEVHYEKHPSLIEKENRERIRKKS